MLSFPLAKLTLNIALNAEKGFVKKRKQNIGLLIDVTSMDENYTTISWFSSTNNDRYDSDYRAKDSGYNVSAKPEFRRGFRTKPGTYIPFPFWHKFVAIPLLLNYTFMRKLVILRMLIRGAYSRKYDRPRKKLGKQMKLF